VPASRPGFGGALIRLPSSVWTNAHCGLTWSMTQTALVPRFCFLLRPFHGLNLRCQFFRSEFRLLQKSLANGFRHGGGRNQRVTASGCTGQLQIEVADDGGGFDPGMPNTGGHFGMDGMRERVQLLGGNFEVKSAPNQGTLIRASPLLLEVEAAMLAVRGSRGDTIK